MHLLPPLERRRPLKRRFPPSLRWRPWLDDVPPFHLLSQAPQNADVHRRPTPQRGTTNGVATRANPLRRLQHASRGTRVPQAPDFPVKVRSHESGTMALRHRRVSSLTKFLRAMNPRCPKILSDVHLTLDKGLHDEAKNKLDDLLAQSPRDELQEHLSELHRVADRFHKKRRRDILAAIAQRLKTEDPTPSDPAPPPRQATATLESLASTYSRRLDILRDHHIFQWTTLYRETIGSLFRMTFHTCRTAYNPDPIFDIVVEAIRRHATDIYQKGLQHVTHRLGLSPDDAMDKSLGGVRGFLSVPPKIYSDLLLEIESSDDAIRLRQLCSSMLLGIISGYGQLRFAELTGWTVLSTQPRIWMSCIGFMTSDHVRTLSGHFDTEANAPHALVTTVLPVLAALDRSVSPASPRYFCSPIVSEYYLRPERLEISLQLPSWAQRKRFIDIHCYLDGATLDSRVLIDALARDIDLLAAGLTPELSEWWQSQEPPSRAILDTTQVAVRISDHEENLVERGHAILKEALLENIGEESGEYIPLVRNYPRDFPLENPLRRHLFLVHRVSVSRMLALFEKETGVHLWCSVRRSGKTTACRDLGSVSGSTVVVNQTMWQEPLEPDLNIFSDRIVAALHTARPLGREFFRNVVRDCAVAVGGLPTENGKMIFVLDEYELLFGLLKAEAEGDERLKYSVVYPILGQMASFSQENLLIFLGQRPNAHFILADHNQLSPLVRQDAFPLFEHHRGATDSEFSHFLQRVVSERVAFDPEFVGAVFEETAGHPYLTVNMMIDFFTWLIDSKRRARGLRLSGGDFERFAKERLTPTALRRSTAYGFMQSLIGDALSETRRTADPWLHAVTVAMRRIGTKFSRTLQCSEPQFSVLVEDVVRGQRWTPADLLRTAQMANFLRFRDGLVGPAIPLFGRLAVVTSPEAGGGNPVGT